MTEERAAELLHELFYHGPDYTWVSPDSSVWMWLSRHDERQFRRKSQQMKALQRAGFVESMPAEIPVRNSTGTCWSLTQEGADLLQETRRPKDGQQ